MPPTTVLGLPYEPWGETDCLLVMARAALRDQICRCGCGQYIDEAHNPASKYTVDVVTCQAGAALERYRKEHPEPEPGQMVTVRRTDAKSDAAEYASLKERLGL